MQTTTTYQPLNLREERDFGQKINATFTFIKQNFKPLFKALLVIACPPILIASILYGNVHTAFFPITTYKDVWLAQGLSAVGLIGFILFAMLGSVMFMLTVYGYMVAYMDSGNQQPEVAEVWEIVKSHLASAIFFGIGFGLMAFVATLILIIPGVYLGVVLSMAFIIKVREETDFVETIERSFFLIKGKWWSTFGLILVVGIIQSLGAFVFQAPLLLVSIGNALQLDFFSNSLYITAASAFYILGVSLMNVFVFVALGMQYFNLVERREGIGYMEQVERIGHTLNGAHEA